MRCRPGGHATKVRRPPPPQALPERPEAPFHTPEDDMSIDKPTNTEEEYFAREEVEKRYKLAKELDAKRAAADAEALRQAHFMKCPKCGNDLATIKFKGVEVDRCFHCGVTVLDEGELEKVAGSDDNRSFLKDVASLFGRR